MIKFWNSIINIGTEPGLTVDRIRKIRLLNGILAIGEIFLILLVTKSLISGRLAEFVVQLAGVILFAIPILTNHFKYFSLAKYLCLLIPIVYLSFLTIFWGAERGSQLILFAVAGLPVLYFDKWNVILLAMAAAMFAHIALELYYIYYEPLYITPNPHFSYVINIFITATLIGVIMGIFKKENYEYQDKISRINSEISSQHEKVVNLNKELSQSLRVIRNQKAELDGIHKRLQDSIHYAETIQQTILSISPDVKVQLKDHFILFRPLDVVSGDFYYLYHRPPYMFVAAVDCTGHGVPGALMSMIGHRLLQEAIEIQLLNDPGKILTFLNNRINYILKQSETTNADGMEMSLVVIDQQAKEIDYSGAKCFLCLHHNGEMIKVKGDRYAIGGFTPPSHQFKTQSFSLKNNDSIYLMSDGFQDQFGGPENKRFKSRKMDKMLKEYVHLSMQEQHKQYVSKLESWMNGHEQTDDILLIGIRV